jgi:hypothetical protein
LVVATLALVVATGVLAVAAIKGLGQLRVAVQQLDEVRADRNVLIFSDFGLRWEGEPMTEALVLAQKFSGEELAALFKRGADGTRLTNPFKERRRQREERERVILLRIPSYFEDVAIVAQAGSLNDDIRFTDNFGGLASELWPKWRLTVKQFQEVDPTYYSEFEQLASSVEAEEQARGVDTSLS